MADQVLHAGVRSITDLMVLPGLINLDFADVRSVMSDMGKAMMGTGEATGDDRAILAAQNAIQNPLLDETSLKGAKAVLVNVTGGLDMTLHEVDEAANAISSEVDPDANIIFGAAFDPNLEGKLRVSVVATGMDGVALQTPLTAPAKATTPPPTFGLGYSARPEAQAAPQVAAKPAVETPVAPAAESRAFTPTPVNPVAIPPRVDIPAPVVAPAVQRSSLFEERAAAPAPAITQAPATEAEPRIVTRIVDPLADEAAPELIKTIEPAPQPEPQVSRPTITRPGAYVPQAQRPAPAPAQRLNTEEEGRESFWRGPFPATPQRSRSGIAGPRCANGRARGTGRRYRRRPLRSRYRQQDRRQPGRPHGSAAGHGSGG